MAAKIGRAVLLTWGGDPVAGVQEKSVAINGDPIDISDDDSGGWRELLGTPGENSVDLSLSGVTKSSGLKEDFFNGNRIKEAVLTYPDGGMITGDFYLVNFNETGNYKEGVTFECSLQSAGEVVYAAGAAPVNAVLPAIAGLPQVGNTLTALPGVWTGARTFTYQWELDGAPIEGATGQTYQPVVGDVDGVLTVVVTAVNSTGSTPAESAPSADVIGE